jgi:PilZ domain
MLKVRPAIKRKRQLVRRRRHQFAWIKLDSETVERKCWVEDVSQNGAKITAEISADVGSQFAIAFVPRAPKRQCEVVWREGNTLGIRFVG